MKLHAELLRLDFAQMLFDGGCAMGVETALAVSQTREWLRSDEPLRLSLDLGLKHFTRLKLLASLGDPRSAGRMRDGLRRDIYPKLADSEAGEWLDDYERMLRRWICPLPDVVVGARPGDEPPLWVPPPEHWWEELLRDVSSLAEKIRRHLGDRAMFRGINFWFTHLHKLGRWPRLSMATASHQAHDYAERIRARLPRKLQELREAARLSKYGLERASGISREMIGRCCRSRSYRQDSETMALTTTAPELTAIKE